MTLSRLLLLAGAGVALAACSSAEIDPELLPAELVDFEPTVRVQRAWSRGVGDETENLRLALRPGSDGARIYAATHDGRVAAFEPDSGRRIWSVATDLPLSAGPSSDGSLVVAGSSNGEVVALATATGEPLWETQVTSEVLGAPALAPGKVLVQTVNGKLTALDSATGEPVWSVQQSMPRLSVRGTSAPVVARNLVIGGFDNGRVAAYALDDGVLVWEVLLSPPSGRTELERLVDINSGIAVAGNDVYAVGYQGRVGAIAIESGQLLWSRDMSSHAGLSVDIGNLYITDQYSEIVALSRGSGRELWRRKELRNRDATGPAVFGTSVVVGDFEGYLHWFDPQTGELQARAKTGSARITSQPLVVNDYLYVMTDDGDIVAFRFRPESRREG